MSKKEITKDFEGKTFQELLQDLSRGFGNFAVAKLTGQPDEIEEAKAKKEVAEIALCACLQEKIA